jgi:hypothetical protein
LRLRVERIEKKGGIMRRVILVLILIFTIFGFGAKKEKDPEDILCSMAKNLSIGNPKRYKNLTIFPLSISKGRDKKSITTLDEAMKKGYIEIKEKSSSEVNTVILVNTSKHYVFILAGEVITGCKQDRMVSEDCLIPPHSGKVYLSVYCTEHGRWTHKTTTFGSGMIAINPSMREVAKASKSQSEVWAEVEEKREEVGAASSPTDAYMDIVEDEEVKKDLKPYLDKFSGIPDVSGWNTVGVIAAVGEEIIVLDLFSNHTLFKGLWKKLIKSYALDAINRPCNGSLSKSDIRDFLNELKDVEICTRDTDGTGDAYTIEGDFSFGTALLFDEKVVHCDLFPREDACPSKSIPTLDFRRERN